LNKRILAAVLIAGTALFITAAFVSAKTPVESFSFPVSSEQSRTIQMNSHETERGPDMVDLDVFVKAVTTGDAEKVTGLYAPGVGHYYVIQQTAGNDSRVSPVDSVLTQFRRPSSGGVIGLLAHNFAAGKNFDRFNVNDTVYLIYGNGAIHTYRVTGFLRYQAVDRNNPSSNLIDLQTGKTQSANSVYQRVYSGLPHLVLQTCLADGDDLKWGRLFILAEKAEGRN
jgi:hypothetical protein